MLNISVIVPVYNAGKYLRKCVESALIQSEVKEVILVEDCSPDNSLEVALQLVLEDSRVKLYQHFDKKNHGAGATRNLAIQKASCEYIAFLDADDFYLPNRFQIDEEVFEKYADAEGVYSAIGIHYYSEEAKKKMGNKVPEITTLSESVPPKELVYVLLGVHERVKGHFHANGLVVKKSIFKKVGLFNEQLKLSQDTHMFIKMASLCNLYTGEVSEPVCLRGVHEENRISDSKKILGYRELLFRNLHSWGLEKKINKNILFYLKNLEILGKIQVKSRQQSFFIFIKHILFVPKSKEHINFYRKSLKYIFGYRISKFLINNSF